MDNSSDPENQWFVTAWIAADPVEKDADATYTFDWDGDGVYEAVYVVKADNLTLSPANPSPIPVTP